MALNSILYFNDTSTNFFISSSTACLFSNNYLISFFKLPIFNVLNFSDDDFLEANKLSSK